MYFCITDVYFKLEDRVIKKTNKPSKNNVLCSEKIR